MFRPLILVLLVLSSILAAPVAYSAHQVCEPGYIETIDSETGFVKCIFEDKIVEEVIESVEFQFADLQEHIQLEINPISWNYRVYLLAY